MRSSPPAKSLLSPRHLTLRGGLTFVIVTSFLFPYLGLTLLVMQVIAGAESIRERTLQTHILTNESLRQSYSVGDKFFTQVMIRESKLIADRTAALIRMQNWSKRDLETQSDFAGRMAMYANDQMRISLIDPETETILSDARVPSGTPVYKGLPLVERFINEKDLAASLRHAQQNRDWDLDDHAIWTVYESSDSRRRSDQPQEIAQYLVILCPIEPHRLVVAVEVNLAAAYSPLTGALDRSLDRIQKSTTEIDQQTTLIIRMSLIASVLGAAFGVLLVLILFGLARRRVLDPVQSLTETADAIRRGDLSRRVEIPHALREVRDLGEMVNRTLDTLIQLIESQADRDRVKNQVTTFSGSVRRVTEGDLSERIPGGEESLRPIVDSFNQMLDGISSMIQQAKEAGQKITLAVVSILDGIQKAGVDARHQEREVGQMASRLQQTARSMQRISIGSETARDEALRAKSAAQEGTDRLDEAIRNIQRMRSNVLATSKTIKTLGERSLEINAIVELIKDISGRTNVLSLNAAIEAGKAGEQGKGFAVVADEIRKLAERTSNATHEVSSFIEDIQIETHNAVLAMEEVTREVEQGFRQTDEAGTTLKRIQADMSDAAEKIVSIHELALALMSQTDAMVTDIHSIHQMSRQNSGAVEQTSAETRNLLDPVGQMNHAIRAFRLAPRFEPNLLTLEPSAAAPAATGSGKGDPLEGPDPEDAGS